MSCMRLAMRLIASTALPVECCMLLICWAVSSVALAVCTASDFTSEATTAKPRPASPARAASMVALSASKLVLPGDVLDELDHVARALRDLGEGGDVFVGCGGVGRGAVHDLVRAQQPAADLLDRCGKLGCRR